MVFAFCQSFSLDYKHIILTIIIIIILTVSVINDYFKTMEQKNPTYRQELADLDARLADPAVTAIPPHPVGQAS